jgi:putative Holliday junction resolvase
MILRNLSELPALLPKNQCLLGIDYGSKVIGVAVSDPNMRVASHLASITRRKFAEDATTLMAIIRERNIGGFIIGLPRNMDGSEGATAQAARAFVRNMVQRGGMSAELPVVFWDERLSTAAVEKFLISSNMSRKRREEIIDKTAAAYILQGALDALQHNISLDHFD